MKIRVTSASMLKSIFTLTILVPLIALLSAIVCLFGSDGFMIWITILFLLGICLFFYPISVALDVSKRIPEISKAKAEHKSLDKISIRHQYFWAIVAINVLFGLTFVGWVVAFIMAHTPCDADLPHEFVDILNPKKPTMEARLTEVQTLVATGVITQEEGSLRRETIIKDV